jgi:rhodanese-related sulfurtransferase
MCGRNISKETSSTIGQQRELNYALKPMAKEEFVQLMTKDLPPAPPYFSHDAERNREGAPPLKELPRPLALSPEEVNKRAAQGHLILDVRPAAEFGQGHAPGSLNIGLSGQFASWAGTLIPMGTPLLIVANEPIEVDEAVVRLSRVGHESVKGFLKGGMDAWQQTGLETASVRQITVAELHALLKVDEVLQLVDVRRPGEYTMGHVPSAASLPLAQQFESAALGLDPQRPTAVICAGGYRSSAATSLFEQRGFTHLLNVTGGTSAWIEAGYPVEKQG